MQDQSQQRRILPAKTVDALAGTTPAQRWRLERAGKFPVRVRITEWRVGYYSDEIDNWIATRPRGMSEIPTPKSPGCRGRAAKAAV